MMVNLCCRDVKYTDAKTKEERSVTRFYLVLNNRTVPINVAYFGSADKPDTNYGVRKQLVKAFSDPLPEKENTAS